MNGVRVVPLPNSAEEAQAPRAPTAGDVPAREALGRDELARLLDAAEQRIDSLHRSERLQQALYEIADLAGGSLELQDMLRRIHAIVGELMYAANLYIVLYDEHRQTMRFLYFVDRIDPWVNDPGEEMPVTDDENTLTMHLLRSGDAMRGPSAELRVRHGILATCCGIVGFWQRQPGHRFAAPGDGEHLASLQAVDQLGQAVLRVEQGNLGHGSGGWQAPPI